MNVPRRKYVLHALCWLPTLACAAPLPLEQVLERAGDGPGMQAASARLEARYAARDQRQSEAGWELYGNANAGRYRELVTDDLRNDYYGRSFAIGVRYPLLGSLRRRLDAVGDSTRDARLSEIEQGYRRAQQRLALRSAYADWWRASEERRLCRSVPQAARDAETQLGQRLRQQWILPSDARLMRTEWQAMVDRCALQDDLLTDIRVSLESLGVYLDPGDTPVPSMLVRQPQPLQAWAPVLQDNQRLASRDAELSNAEHQRKRPWYTAIESYVSVAQSVEQRSGAVDNGSGLNLGLTLSAPIDLLDYGSARGREGEARYQAAVRAREQEQGELLRELGTVIAQQRRSVNDYQRLSTRREGLHELLSEREQRGDLDAGEASIRLQQARIDDYNAGFAQIAAWHRVWLQDAALRLFGDDDRAIERLLGEQRLRWNSSASTHQMPVHHAWTQGTYVWDSRALLDPAQREAELTALGKAGIGQVYLGLSAAQVKQPEQTHAALRALLTAAHAKRIRVEVLLGDPDWITPEGRPGLLALITQLSSLPFDGLHMDLEVEQLGWPVSDQHLRDWMQTLRAAKATSPWPVSLSSHPRWFEMPKARLPCVPCELQGMGVNTISLMIYTRNASRSGEKAVAIANRWPGLSWRLAQSLEADQPREVSWVGSSSTQLNAHVTQWRTALQPTGLQGIDWQSWTDFPRR